MCNLVVRILYSNIWKEKQSSEGNCHCLIISKLNDLRIWHNASSSASGSVQSSVLRFAREIQTGIQYLISRFRVQLKAQSKMGWRKWKLREVERDNWWNRIYCVQLSAVDTSAITTMKNAAKRDINCELQNSVNHRNFERNLEPWVLPLATPFWVSLNM